MQRKKRAGTLGRRSFMSSSVAALGLAGCDDVSSKPFNFVPAQPSLLNRPIVDAHAHVFNAKDLEAFPFIHQCYVERYVGLGLEAFMPTLRSYAEKIQQNSPGYDAEMAALQGPPAPSNAPPAVELLTQAVVDTTPPAPPVAASAPSVPRADKNVEALDRVAAAPPGVGQRVQARAIAERLLAIPAPAAAPAAAMAASAGPASAPAATPATTGQFAQLFTWFHEFTQYRRERVEAWSNLIGGSGARFVMPALVDFDYSLAGTTSTPVSVWQQAELMGALARRQPEGRLMHGYAAFNPVRHMLNPDSNEAMMRAAIDQHGFIGAKIYPPMGFQASGNDKLSMSLFHVAGFSSGQLAVGIERSLWWLYEFCNDNQLSILVHTAPSNTPHGNPYDGVGAEMSHANDWSRRPDPQYWTPVLAKYPNLRVNLGHFGGAYDIKSNLAWAKSVITLMRNHPNVYADFADYDLVLANNAGQLTSRNRLANFLAGLDGKDKELLATRILFGTDWEMLGLVPDHQFYAQNMLGFLRDTLGDKVDDYAARNALKFIGLNEVTSKNSARLLAFHAPGTPGRKTLDQFMGIAAQT